MPRHFAEACKDHAQKDKLHSRQRRKSEQTGESKAKPRERSGGGGNNEAGQEAPRSEGGRQRDVGKAKAKRDRSGAEERPQVTVIRRQGLKNIRTYGPKGDDPGKKLGSLAAPDADWQVARDTAGVGQGEEEVAPGEKDRVQAIAALALLHALRRLKVRQTGEVVWWWRGRGMRIWKSEGKVG